MHERPPTTHRNRILFIFSDDDFCMMNPGRFHVHRLIPAPSRRRSTPSPRNDGIRVGIQTWNRSYIIFTNFNEIDHFSSMERCRETKKRQIGSTMSNKIRHILMGQALVSGAYLTLLAVREKQWRARISNQSLGIARNVDWVKWNGSHCGRGKATLVTKTGDHKTKCVEEIKNGGKGKEENSRIT